MNGTRHRPGLSGRRSALLLSVLALAFASLSGTALAQPPTYLPDEPPTAEGGPIGAGGGNSPSARGSSADIRSGGGTGPSSAATGGGSNHGSASSGSGSSSGGGGGVAADGNGGSTGKGSPAVAGEDQAENGKNGVAQSTGVNAQEKGDDGGSSPLVPILIAIAVLAAISIGVLLWKQRQRSGSLSPDPS